MKSVLSLAFAGVAVAQNGYGNPPPAPYGGNSSSSSSTPIAPHYGGSTSSSSSSSPAPPHYGGSTTSSSASATTYGAQPTPSCPAPGDYNSQGQYSCNPAHQYPAGQTCELVDGCLYLVYHTTSAKTYPVTTSTSSASYPTSKAYTTEVVTEYTTYCPQPTTFTHKEKTYTVTSATTLTLPCKGGCTVTKPVSKPVYSVPTTVYPALSKSKVWYNATITQSKPDVYTTKVVTSLTTYCPQPTTFVHGPSTYTVTKATTLTLPCEKGCTVTATVPPVYTTKIVTTPVTTYCPTPTTISYQGTTITVTKPTHITIPCEKGCTVYETKPPVYTTKIESTPVQPPKETYPAQPPKETHPVQPPVETHPVQPPKETYPAQPPKETYPVQPPVETHPVQPPKETYPAQPPVETHPVQPPVETHPAPPAPKPSTYQAPSQVVPPPYPTQQTSSVVSVTRPSASFPATTSSIVQYTGAAAPMKTGAPIVAAIAMGAFFL